MRIANCVLTQVLILVLWVINVNTIDEECGRPIGSISTGKIVGGYDMGYYKYPWFVALMRGGDAFCGGTLIAKRFVVTAAHCFQPFFKAVEAGHMKLENVFTPTLGVYNICRHESTQKEFKMAKVHVHDNYRKKDPYYDIALIKLNREAKGFEVCCLPRKALSDREKPIEAYINGLGDLQWHSKTATCTMHEARILVYNDQVCRNMLNSQQEDGSKLKNAFCAGYLEGGIDGCQGDSGGPLHVIEPGSGRFVVLGITSFGFECALPNVLGIYTDVSQYLDWLRIKMRESDQSPPTSTTTTTTTTTSRSTIDGDNLLDDPSTEGTTSFPVHGTTLNWSIYPATPWEPVAITPFPYPDEPIVIHEPHATIVINIFTKKRKGKNLRKDISGKARGHSFRNDHWKRKQSG